MSSFMNSDEFICTHCTTVNQIYITDKSKIISSNITLNTLTTPLSTKHVLIHCVTNYNN